MHRLPVLSLLLAAFSLGCQPPLPSKSAWKGEVPIAEGRILEFRLNLDLETTPPTGAFIVGDERTAIPEVISSADSIHLVISEYGVAMRAAWDGSSLRGRYFRYRQDTTFFVFTALPESPSIPVPPPLPTVALIGTFRMFTDGKDGIDSSTSAKFWSRNDSLFGTFISADGDMGLLAGRQVGDTVVLQRFTGWQLLRYEFRRRGTSWDGLSFVRNLPPTRFTIEPRPGEEPRPVSNRATRSSNPGTRFRFSGITPEGRRMDQDSPEFKGKAVIIDIMGTWCHNCLDAAPVLQSISDEYFSQGVAVIGLAFELTPDTLLARKNLSLYKKRYGLTYTLLFCGSTDRKYTQPILHDQLTDFFAYPTTLFLDRKGVIRNIHVGFRGPGTGDEYQREVQALYAKVSNTITR